MLELEQSSFSYSKIEEGLSLQPQWSFIPGTPHWRSSEVPAVYKDLVQGFSPVQLTRAGPGSQAGAWWWQKGSVGENKRSHEKSESVIQNAQECWGLPPSCSQPLEVCTQSPPPLASCWKPRNGGGPRSPEPVPSWPAVPSPSAIRG